MDKPSLEGLIRFLDRLIAQGEIPSATGSGLKSSVSRVFGIVDPPPGDVFKVDVDLTLRRFANLEPSVSSESLRTYRSRIEKALSLFRQYLDDPVNFKIASSRAARPAATQKPRKTDVSPRRTTETAYAEARSDGSASFAPVAGLSYPFPLRSDLTIMLSNLPRDLKMSEADRIAAFLRSLAEDFKP